MWKAIVRMAAGEEVGKDRPNSSGSGSGSKDVCKSRVWLGQGRCRGRESRLNTSRSSSRGINHSLYTMV